VQGTCMYDRTRVAVQALFTLLCNEPNANSDRRCFMRPAKAADQHPITMPSFQCDMKQEHVRQEMPME